MNSSAATLTICHPYAGIACVAFNFQCDAVIRDRANARKLKRGGRNNAAGVLGHEDDRSLIGQVLPIVVVDAVPSARAALDRRDDSFEVVVIFCDGWRNEGRQQERRDEQSDGGPPHFQSSSFRCCGLPPLLPMPVPRSTCPGSLTMVLLPVPR